MVNLPVLVLNQDYQPLNISPVRRAVILVLRGKAEIVENGSGEIHTPTTVLPLPSVIRLLRYIYVPKRQRKFTRFEIFNRDKFTCQYFGKRTSDLTLDHVIPRHRGGAHSWENVVSACIPCNRRKAGRTPEEAGMRLIRRPQAPPAIFTVPYYYIESFPQWLRFLPRV